MRCTLPWVARYGNAERKRPHPAQQKTDVVSNALSLRDTIVTRLDSGREVWLISASVSLSIWMSQAQPMNTSSPCTARPAALGRARTDNPKHTSPRIATAIAAIGVLGALPGCLVGPDYSKPETAVNQAWQPTQASQEAINPRWWETFQDPVLDRLVQIAAAQNLSLRTAGLRVLEARAARGIAVGQFFPQLQQVSGAIGASQLSANSENGQGDRSFSSANLGLDAAWELDFWGKFRRGIEAADAELLATIADYDAVLVSLQADIATNYILLRSLQERLVFARANVELQTETLALTETRFRAGAVSELDVSTARSTLANTQALIPDLQNALVQARLAIGVLLARTPSDLEDLLASPSGPRLPEAPGAIAAGIPAELLRRRPDVRSAERFAAAQSARIGQAAADLYPAISINGSTGFASSTYEGRRSPNLGNIFDADSFAGFVGLGVNWPFFNYGRIENNVRVRDARYEQAVAQYQESVLRAAADVEAGLSAFLNARERTGFLSQAVAASERSAELSLVQYRAGAVDFIRVNQAQTDLVQQQDNLVAARAEVALGAIRTFRALGGGWIVREGQEFIDPDTAQRMRARTDWGKVLDPNWESRSDLGFKRPAEERWFKNAPAPQDAQSTPPTPQITTPTQATPVPPSNATPGEQ